MGYAFSFDKPDDGVAVGCVFNGHQMTYVRLVMIEAGAVSGDGFTAAMSYPGLEPGPDTVPVRHFLSNGGWHVTAAESAFIAARLRRAVDLRVAGDLLSFLDDAPGTREVTAWVEEFAAFNEEASTRDGYYVH